MKEQITITLNKETIKFLHHKQAEKIIKTGKNVSISEIIDGLLGGIIHE